MGPIGPRWAPCWPHKPCYQGKTPLMLDDAWIRNYITRVNVNLIACQFHYLVRGYFISLGESPKWDFLSMVSCQKGPTRHAYAWQIGPFWQDTLVISMVETASLIPMEIFRPRRSHSNTNPQCLVKTNVPYRNIKSFCHYDLISNIPKHIVLRSLIGTLRKLPVANVAYGRRMC